MFGKRLRSMRMKRNFTQPQLADMLDIALRTYQGYEGETRSPSFDTLIKMADILDVSLDYLLGRDDFMKAHAISFDEYL
ncbi:MAG: helix-turn-helix transcriptional regulator [Lachnospiraceae bacterium]|nr:helix-turn-helix transcriptional regulator [Lachnospiraceae bacterium]